MDYRVIRSKRKTLALQIREAELIVRAPLKVSERDIRKFVAEHTDWIEKHLSFAAERKKMSDSVTPLSKSELDMLKKRAKAVFSERAEHYARPLGVSFGKITVRCQKTRWGSCSSKGNLSFNIALMLAPTEVLDSVVVHELCHRKEMNHSKSFYSEVYSVFPEYDKWHGWLKENGACLMAKMRIT